MTVSKSGVKQGFQAWVIFSNYGFKDFKQGLRFQFRSSIRGLSYKVGLQDAFGFKVRVSNEDVKIGFGF